MLKGVKLAKLEMINNPMRNNNHSVRQLRWSNGKLLSEQYIKFVVYQLIYFY
jgi:hypothetical protein